VGYELAKVVKYATNYEKKLGTDPRFPVLPPSLDAVDWGLRGVKDGLADFSNANPGKTGKVGAAYEANKDLASGQYKGMYSKDMYSKRY
jgi:hypothetical protein